MEKITITVDVDGNSITREYRKRDWEVADSHNWGERVESMLDTLEKSNEEKF